MNLHTHSRYAFGLCSAVLLMPSAALAAGSAPQPGICVRSCWGAVAPNKTITQMSALTRAIVHHTADSTFNTSGLEQSKANMRSIQSYHRNTNGWGDIGYHFVIDKYGHIFEGRQGSMTSLPRGAHDAANTNSFGFTLMGYFHPNVNNTPTAAMLDSLYDVIAWRMPGGWTPYGSPGGTYGNLGNTVGRIDAHRRVVATACPGDLMYGPYMGSNLNGGVIRDQVNQRIQGASRVAPSMFYDLGNGAMNIYRWASSGSSFSTITQTGIGSGYSLSNVGQHMASSDVNGDGHTDNVVAYQYPDGTMRLHVFLGGSHYQGADGWFQSGTFSMANVDGRMVGGDFDGNGKGDVAMLYKSGSGSVIAFRFLSNGSSFSYDSSTLASGYDLANVTDHVAASDINGDGRTDIVSAYQYPDGTMRLHAWINGNSYAGGGGWFQSGTFSLANVDGRMVGGDFDGNGKGDIAMLYSTGSGSMALFRFLSNGSSFTYDSTSIASGYSLSSVGKNVAAGDTNSDGRADIVTAYQYPDGTFRYHVWLSGNSYQGGGGWFQSGPFDLSRVAGRMTMGSW